jgi:hypothetical protein
MCSKKVSFFQIDIPQKSKDDVFLHDRRTFKVAKNIFASILRSFLDFIEFYKKKRPSKATLIYFIQVSTNNGEMRVLFSEFNCRINLKVLIHFTEKSFPRIFSERILT